MLKSFAILASLILLPQILHASDCPLLIAGGIEMAPWRDGTSVRSTAELESFLDTHPNIKGIGLVHFGQFNGDILLAPLNHHSHITKLVLSGSVENPAIFNLSALRYITHFVNNLTTGMWGNFGQMPNLVSLQTSLNHFPHLRPMPQLRRLSLLEYHESEDIGFSCSLDKFCLQEIGQYTNLVKLRLHLDWIQDLSPIGDLTNLTKLCVGGGDLNVEKFAFLTRLTKLTSLIVGEFYSFNTKIKYGKAWLEKDRDFLLETTTEPGFFEFLGTLHSLKNLALNMYVNPVDVTGLQHCSNLECLMVHNPYITSADPFSLLPLRKLELECETLSDLTPLSRMTRLEDLSLVCFRGIGPIEPLGMLSLKRLELYGIRKLWREAEKTYLPELEGLSSITNLETLTINCKRKYLWPHIDCLPRLWKIVTNPYFNKEQKTTMLYPVDGEDRWIDMDTYEIVH